MLKLKHAQDVCSATCICPLPPKIINSENVVLRFASLKNAFVQQNLSMKKDDYFAMMAYNNSKLLNITTAKVH